MGLVLSSTHVEELSRALHDLLKHAEGKCALLVDQDGRCLVKAGGTKSFDADALSALIAGSFASTRALAQIVGESEFSVLFHQGEKDHIHNLLVDNNTILAVIFDDRTTVGMVRLYSKEAATRAKEILDRVRQENRPEPVASAASTEAAQETKNRIDDIFGD